MAKPIRKLWTTTAIANLVGIDRKLIRQYVDDGVIKSITLPSFTERRIHRKDLRQFLTDCQYWHALREMDEETGSVHVYPDEEAVATH